MKKLILIMMFLISVLVMAEPSDALGLWLTESGKNGNQLIVDIYKGKDDLYYGKIVGMTKPKYTEGEYIGQEKMDLKNPDKNLQNKPLVGLEFIKHLKYNDENEKFEDGTIYSPENGKTYYSYIKLEKDGKLLLKGSIDSAGLFGKKQYWTRYKK